MKIFESSYDIEVGRLVYTNNPFRLLKNIAYENKDVLIVTPFTKVKEVINLNKNGGLEQFIVEQGLGIEEILNISLINEAFAKVNNVIQTEIVELNLDFQKLIKTIIEQNETFINEQNINFILDFVNKYALKLPQIVIAGFEKVDIIKSVSHIELISSFTNKVNYKNLEGLLIDQENSLFEVHDVEAFISWLELKTGTALNEQMINNFLNGKVDISSYLINIALKDLK